MLRNTYTQNSTYVCETLIAKLLAGTIYLWCDTFIVILKTKLKKST